MAGGNVALLLFFAHIPTVIGASIPSWLSQPGTVSRESDAGDNSVIHTPTWPPSIEAFLHANNPIEQKAYLCNEICGADGADCTENYCSESIGAGVALDSSSNMTSSVDDSSEDDYVYCYTA